MRASLVAFLFAPLVAAADPAGGTWLVGPSAVEVDEVRILVRCTEENRRAGCVFTETYSLHNPTSGDVTTSGAFYGSNVAELSIAGNHVEPASASEEFAALDRFVQDAGGTPKNLRESGRLDDARTRFSFTLPAGARTTLTTSGSVEPTNVSNRHSEGGFVFPAYLVRHVFLGGKTHSTHEVDFRWLVHPIRAWSGAKKVRVEVRWPNTWDFARPVLDGAPPFELADDGTEKVSRVEADGSKAGTLQLTFAVRGNVIVNGGPFLGIGGQFEPGEVRLRAGYEIAGPDWASYSIAGETNAKDRGLVALVAEASLPNVFIFFPGIGVGAGPMVGGGPRGAFGGARIQATLSWPFLAMVIPIDISTPSFTTGSGVLVTGAILAQTSF
jgi:hypothetical protein